MIDLLVTGGHVVTPFQEGDLDVGISGETIAYVAPPGAVEAEAGRVIDAIGKLVFPGGVEPHAHIHEPMHRGWSQGREVWLQPPEGATRAALFGGTTTVVSFAFMDVHVEHQELDCAAAVAHRREIFERRSYADFAFHPVLTGTPSETTLATVADAVADGTATFKFFTTDLTTTQTGIRFDNGSVRALLEECARLGAVAMVHAEDDDPTPGGHAGIETRGPIGFSEGVGRRGFSLRRFVEVFATNPARVTGLYPRNGVIAPGSHADLVIWDPELERTITMDELHHDGNYSPWEGWQVEGWPVTTILRGRVVVEDGRLHAEQGDGRFIPRKIDADVLDGPLF